MDAGSGVAAAVLDGVADKVLKRCSICVSIAMTFGSSLLVTTAPFFFD
jgi:hypothetical protein